MNSHPNPAGARAAVLTALARLRQAFPLERRMRAAERALQQAYAQVLHCWLQARMPRVGIIAQDSLDALTRLDALAPDTAGLGCYPFSARATGIEVQLPGGTVPAMCAIDALAVARLAGSPVTISAGCGVCGHTIACRVEANGSLDHDQTETARVLWKNSVAAHGTCSDHLCRDLLFLCPRCEPPAGSDCYTLPQATTIANAFFSFQLSLLRAHPDETP